MLAQLSKPREFLAMYYVLDAFSVAGRCKVVGFSNIHGTCQVSNLVSSRRGSLGAGKRPVERASLTAGDMHS